MIYVYEHHLKMIDTRNGANFEEVKRKRHDYKEGQMRSKLRLGIIFRISNIKGWNITR